MSEREIHELRPTVWVGKQGLTEEVIREIVSQLKARRMVKIRFLRKSTMEADLLEDATGGHILEVRGRNVVLVSESDKNQSY
ncbi:MAG: YhbY family RNA-binding protein [Methanomicrobiales archaeon]|nr:YhbY family RNA-binding protein [Methanomicrobiales archaeon]